MKQDYQAPETEITEFGTDDVIVTSTENPMPWIPLNQ